VFSLRLLLGSLCSVAAMAAISSCIGSKHGHDTLNDSCTNMAGLFVYLVGSHDGNSIDSFIPKISPTQI
jgi:hypothetical protein